MTLVTGAVMLVTGVVTLVTCPYMPKNGGKVLGQDTLSEQVGARAVEICVVHWHLSCGFPILSVVDRLLDRALTSKLEIGHLRAVRQHSSCSFPSNKFVNIWACMRYEKYP